MHVDRAPPPVHIENDVVVTNLEFSARLAQFLHTASSCVGSVSRTRTRPPLIAPATRNVPDPVRSAAPLYLGTVD